MPQSNRWVLIVNPAAGHGRGLTMFPRIARVLRAEGISIQPLFAEHRFHATQLAVEAIARGERRILVVGGDGTMHEVVNGLMLSSVSPEEVLLALAPVGSHNVWAFEQGLPRHIDTLARAMRAGLERRVDMGRVSYEESHYRQVRYVLNMRIRYARAGRIRRFLGFRSSRALPLRLDGERLDGHFLGFELLPESLRVVG